MEPASKLRAIEVRRMSHVTGTLKWAAGNAHAELWRRSVANQGGTAEFIWSFGPLSEMAEDRMIFYFIGNYVL